MKTFKIFIFIFIISVSPTHAETFGETGFEVLDSVALIDQKPGGSIQRTDFYGIWIDGGYSVSRKTSESYDGLYSVAIEPLHTGRLDGNGNPVVYKERSGSVYTKPIRVTKGTTIELTYNALRTNSSGIKEGLGTVSTEISYDLGHSWNQMTVLDVDGQVIKSTSSEIIRSCKSVCAGVFPFGPFRTTCYSDCDNKTSIFGVQLEREFWSENIFGGSFTAPEDTTVMLRFKTNLNPEHNKTKVFIDDIAISYTGNTPVLAEDLDFAYDAPLAENGNLFDSVTFDGPDSATTVDWGIWQDGGRNAFTSSFLAEDGNAFILRSHYQEGVANELGPNGEDQGLQQPTYSSITTKVTDFSQYDSLQLKFSFVAYQTIGDRLKSASETDPKQGFKVSITTNAGVDYTDVVNFEAGEDFINLKRYNVQLSVPGNITSNGRMTTTTQVKIQAVGETESQQIAIDNLELYTVGTRPSLAGDTVHFNWEDFPITRVSATDGSVDTYDVINNAFTNADIVAAGTYEGGPNDTRGDVDNFPCILGAVEHSDLSHPDAGEHIQQVFDDELGMNVFAFSVHQDSNDNPATAGPDTDRCRLDGKFDDRQRVEIKTYSDSDDHQIGLEDETHYMSWLMRLPEGFQASDKFTHLHQIKSRNPTQPGGYVPEEPDTRGEKKPLITLTAVSGKTDTDSSGNTYESSPARLNLRYSPTYLGQVTLDYAETSQLMGKWVQVLEKITFSGENKGRYEILIVDPANLDAEPIMDFASYSLPMWKDDGELIRPKWGIYRSIVQSDMLRDETVKFADFVILENNDENAKFGDLIDFGYYVKRCCAVTSIGNLL